MKRILLTAFTAALFSVAAIAQQQDSVENAQYRGKRQAQKRATQTVDSAANNASEDARREGQEVREGINQAGNEMERNTDQAGDSLKGEVERSGEIRLNTPESDRKLSTGESLGNEINEQVDENKQEAERTGNKVKQNTEQAGQNIQQGAEQTGNEVNENVNKTSENAERTIDPTKQNTQSFERNQKSRGMQGNNSATMNSENTNAPFPDIEVVESKEGPQNQVVYKYQGELYYVDRETKQFVKAKEAELVDTKHKMQIHEGTAINNSSKAKRKSKG